MPAMYTTLDSEFEINNRKSIHLPPHIHNSMECIYITAGTLELGVGQEFYHMEKGDFAIVFPDTIHHYQVFDTGKCTAIHLLAAPEFCGLFADRMNQQMPENPVIPAKLVHRDIIYAMKSLCEEKGQHADIVRQAFVQIILARSFPHFTMTTKKATESKDIVDRTVEYIARNFKEEITLTSMAEELYVSPYALSRVFSGTFHMNFNKYLNQTRLTFAVNRLKYSDDPITDIYMDAGFESQRTFNRVFQEIYRMSPRDYRKVLKEELDEELKNTESE